MAIRQRWQGTRPILLSTDEAIASAVSLFSSDPKIIAAYLFGSRASGAASRDSDIDLAFHSDRFDLLWLDRAAPDITFDVIKFGRMIFHRGDELLNDFELYAKKRFWDYKIYLRERRLVREADRA